MKKNILIITSAILSGALLTFYIMNNGNENGNEDFQLKFREEFPLFTLGEGRPFLLTSYNPITVSAASSTNMRPDDLVLGLSYNGAYRAYPRWVISSYHVINDTINKRPLVISHCEVCSGAAAFIPTLPGNRNQSLSFGLCEYRKATFSICDIQTSSRWHPFSGFAVEGTLAGTQMERIPVKIMKWKNWKRAHPETDVVDANSEVRSRIHGNNSWGEIGNTMLPLQMKITAKLDDKRLSNFSLIFGIKPENSDGYAITTENMPENSMKEISINAKKYLFFRGLDYEYSLYAIGDSFKSKILFNKNQNIFYDELGNKWDRDGHYLNKKNPQFDFSQEPGYFTEWYEWVSNNPKTAIAF